MKIDLKDSLFSAILFLHPLVSIAQLSNVSSGSLKHFENFPSRYVDSRNVDVWLPSNYSPKKKYCVLYMHDGQMLFDSTVTWNKQEWQVDETMSRLLDEKKIKDCIVVGIWNNGKFRHAEYTPQKAVVNIPDSIRKELMQVPDEGFKGDDYLKFIVYELKPFIDSTFSTQKDQQHTFICGSSMGGMISLYAICEYPQVFGGAACLSTHWTGLYRANQNPVPDAVLAYMNENLPSPAHHKIYFDHGTATLDTLYAPFQVQADSIMKKHGYSTKNFVTEVYDGTDHSEHAWAKRFSVPVLFLLKR